jgi:hypothetical protein
LVFTGEMREFEEYPSTWQSVSDSEFVLSCECEGRIHFGFIMLFKDISYLYLLWLTLSNTRAFTELKVIEVKFRKIVNNSKLKKKSKNTVILRRSIMDEAKTGQQTPLRRKKNKEGMNQKETLRNMH